MRLQHDDTREQVIYNVSDGGSFLRMHLSEKSFKRGVVNEPRDSHRQRGWLLGQL